MKTITIIPAGSNYHCRKCGCIGGKFCVDWSLHKFEQPQREKVAS